jgi:alpha-galactosidase
MIKNVLQLTVISLLTLYFHQSFSQHSDRLLPSMGWEPWSISHCVTNEDMEFDEAYYIRLMDLMDSLGYKDAGYRYLIIECDDHYRDENGKWTVNKNKFPNGYKSVIDYAHKKGFKIKAYTDAGIKSCCCNDRGSFGFYEEDAMAWAEFNFDGVKIDWCGGNRLNLDPKTQFIEFYEAITKHITKPFDVEICSWGKGNPWEWGRFAGSIWRTSGDVDALYEPFVPYFGGLWEALLRNIDENRHPDTTYVGPGKGFNYADMLLTGLPGGLNETEERTQFSIWAIMASPLYISSDLFNIPDYAKDILLNKEVIQINQDPLGIQGDVVKESRNGKLQVWLKPLEDNSIALAFFNRGDNAMSISVSLKELGLKDGATVRDIWNQQDLGYHKKRLSAKVNPHETLMYKITSSKN